MENCMRGGGHDSWTITLSFFLQDSSTFEVSISSCFHFLKGKFLKERKETTSPTVRKSFIQITKIQYFRVSYFLSRA